jgi:hypothetical protein
VITIGVEPYGIVIFTFKGEAAPGEIIPSGEGQIGWFTPSEAAALPLVEDLPTLLPRIHHHQPGDAPFFARYTYDDHGKLHISFSS